MTSLDLSGGGPTRKAMDRVESRRRKSAKHTMGPPHGQAAARRRHGVEFSASLAGCGVGRSRSEATLEATAGNGGLADQVSRQIEQTLSYVPVVARRFLGRGVSHDELVAAGNLGLVEAALRFDASRNVKFITYADWWIRKTIHGAIEACGPVRLPRYQHERLRCLLDARRDFFHRHGRDPDTEQIASAMRLPRSEIERLLHMLRGPLSLESPAYGPDDRPLGETLVDPGTEDPQGDLARRDMTQRLRNLLHSLTEREHRVIELRFGIDGEGPLTLRQAGRKLGISRERVRQLELRTLGKLKQMI